jgi:hypothetical protein
MIFDATGATHDVLVAVEPEDVTAGGIGFVVIAALAVGTALLLRSLNTQLKKVDFEEAPENGAPGPEAPENGAPEPDGPETGDTEPGGPTSEGPDSDATTDRTGDEPVRNGPAGDDPEAGPRSPAP